MFTALFEKLTRHEDLSAEEAADAMGAIMDAKASASQVAGLLMALAMKGERPAEIVGFARAMRARAVPFSAGDDGVMDVCGTGGDRAGTFNISSVAGIVAAAAGVRIAKHGNRSVSSRCGSADVFEALGVRTAAPTAVVERTLAATGITFLFAPSFHPSMKNAAGVRRELGMRTAFNLLGPLTNPARPTRQLVGVPRPELTELIARALAMLGCERAWVVHGADGLDEISTTGYTKVSECRNGAVNTFYLHPSDVGLPKAAPAALAGGDAATNAGIARAIFEGERGPRRDVVLMNAGAALLLAGRARDLRDGIAIAEAALDSGRAAKTLAAMVQASNAN